MIESSFRHALHSALSRPGDPASAGLRPVIDRPAAVALTDVLVREVRMGVARGLEGWEMAGLADRLSLFVGTPNGAEMVEPDRESDVWSVLEMVHVSGDAPAIEAVDAYGTAVLAERVVSFGALPDAVALEVARLVPGLDDLAATAMRLDGDQVSLPVVARLSALEGPEIDACEVWGLSGAILRIRAQSVMAGGVYRPELHLLVDLPLERMIGGVLGARGMAAEDVRGEAWLREVATHSPFDFAAGLALARIDDDAVAQGDIQIGFAGRVAQARTMGIELCPEELLSAVTDVLPHLARQYSDRKAEGDSVSAFVLRNGIISLITRRREDPARARTIAGELLDHGLAPHVDGEDVYWLPIGEYPETLPPDAHERVWAERLSTM